METVKASQVGPCDWLVPSELVTGVDKTRPGTVRVTVASRKGGTATREYRDGDDVQVQAQAITVARLRQLIEGLPGETLLVLSCDPEGNGYAAAGQAVPAGFRPESPDWLAEDGTGATALVLYPLPAR
jgi:hypothetical protein